MPVVSTPNNGLHVFFKQPNGEALGNVRGSLPPGIDVRGDGDTPLTIFMAQHVLYEGLYGLFYGVRCPEVRLSRRSGPNIEPSLIYLNPRPDGSFDGLPKEIVGRSDSRPASQV